MTDTLKHARVLVGLGYSVFPLDHPDETTQTDPDKIGKTPHVPWKLYQTERAGDGQLAEWFGNAHKRNIAIATGALSNLVVVDCDSPEAIQWADTHLPPTPFRVRTGRDGGGEHRAYAHPGVPVGNKVKIKTGDPAIKIDVRGDGGYIVAPGSLHSSRRTYDWVGATEDVVAALRNLPVFDPAWLATDAEPEATPPLANTVGAGERNNTLFKEGCRLRQMGWDEPEILAALTALNQHRCKPPLQASDITTLAAQCAKYARGETDSAAPRITVRNASAVVVEKIEKAFGGRLVRGAFGLLSGPGEAGKGMFLMDTVSRLTTGEPFPGEKHRRQPLVVLICVVEDSEGTVVSRLRAAGADLEMVRFVEGPEVVRGGLKMPSPMMLDDDAGPLVRVAKEHAAQALVLETVVEHFGDRGGKSRRSTHNEADVRSALAPFRAMCAQAGLYGLGAIHPNKGSAVVDNSISGSAAFRNVARAVHHIYRDPEDEDANPTRLLFTSKANYQPQRPLTLRFHIRSWDAELRVPCTCNDADCGHEGRVVWESDLVDPRTADEIWQQVAERGKPRRDLAVQEAEQFLRGLMKDGVIALAPKQIFTLADEEGITEGAIKKAKKNLGLTSVRANEFQAGVNGWRVADGDM